MFGIPSTQYNVLSSLLDSFDYILSSSLLLHLTKLEDFLEMLGYNLLFKISFDLRDIVYDHKTNQSVTFGGIQHGYTVRNSSVSLRHWRKSSHR